jgi:hypothetical protein
VKKNFLLLVALTKAEPRLLQEALSRLKREADPLATPAWLDSTAAGIFMSTDLQTRHIISCVLPANPTHEQQSSIREVLIMELGENFLSSSRSSTAAAWMNAHRRRGSPA